MSKSFLAAVLLIASSAWATGERVVLAPLDNPLRESLCISMTCVSFGARDAVVTTRAKGRELELTVVDSTGKTRLTATVPLSADGHVSSADAIHATTLAIGAIEGSVTRPVATVSAAPKPAAKKVALAKVGRGAKKKGAKAVLGSLVARR
jgi:hypothetical protein